MAKPDPALATGTILLERFKGRPLIPIEEVCSYLFPHLTPARLTQKVRKGEIGLPLVTVDDSQKATKLVHVRDLAHFIDTKHQASIREFSQP